jgi:hypothetical protein
VRGDVALAVLNRFPAHLIGTDDPSVIKPSDDHRDVARQFPEWGIVERFSG